MSIAPGTSAIFPLPHNVYGFLEWSTGLLRINATVEELARGVTSARQGLSLANNQHRATIQLLRTVEHEQFHFRQVLASGFLYSLAYIAFLLCVKRAAPGPIDLRTVLEKIDERDDASGLSTRDLVESSAFLYECKSLWPPVNHAGYVEFLNREFTNRQPPGPEYRRAFDYAHRHLGPLAYSNFLLAAAIALQFAAPHRAFPAIIAAMVKCGAEFRSAQDLSLMDDIVPVVRRQFAFMGTAAQSIAGAHGDGPLIHPFYTPTVRDLVARGGEDVLPLLIVDPPSVGVHRDFLVQPTLFNCDTVQVPRWFRSTPRIDLPGGRSLTGTVEELMQTWIHLAVTCQTAVKATSHELYYRTIG